MCSKLRCLFNVLLLCTRTPIWTFPLISIPIQFCKTLSHKHEAQPFYLYSRTLHCSMLADLRVSIWNSLLQSLYFCIHPVRDFLEQQKMVTQPSTARQSIPWIPHDDWWTSLITRIQSFLVTICSILTIIFLGKAFLLSSSTLEEKAEKEPLKRPKQNGYPLISIELVLTHSNFTIVTASHFFLSSSKLNKITIASK